MQSSHLLLECFRTLLNGLRPVLLVDDKQNQNCNSRMNIINIHVEKMASSTRSSKRSASTVHVQDGAASSPAKVMKSVPATPSTGVGSAKEKLPAKGRDVNSLPLSSLSASLYQKSRINVLLRRVLYPRPISSKADFVRKFVFTCQLVLQRLLCSCWNFTCILLKVCMKVVPCICE